MHINNNHIFTHAHIHNCNKHINTKLHVYTQTTRTYTFISTHSYTSYTIYLFSSFSFPFLPSSSAYDWCIDRNASHVLQTLLYRLPTLFLNPSSLPVINKKENPDAFVYKHTVSSSFSSFLSHLHGHWFDILNDTTGSYILRVLLAILSGNGDLGGGMEE